MSNRFAPPPQVKRQPRSPDPAVQFAFNQGLITKGEMEAALKGDIMVSLQNKAMMNLNAPRAVLDIPTGTWVQIYTGRADALLTARLLGTPFKERPLTSTY